jgi:hypothetical protein
METVECKCKHCGSIATVNFFERRFPSFDDEGRFDGEDVVTYDEIVCHNPDCNNVYSGSDWTHIPLHQQDCDDELPF